MTHQGLLYKFRVMPFGLMNAPAVFQRLKQQVLMGLNPEPGPDHIAVYLDDILIFSRSSYKRTQESSETSVQETGRGGTHAES